MKALIDKIPDSSTYTVPLLFFRDLNREPFLNRVQVKDMRWDMERIEQIIQADLKNDFGRMLQIKEAQYSQFNREILRSICLYKPKHQFKDTFEYYYNHLKRQIHYFANDERFASQKLRCYVGDSCWDILHRDGVLKANHVDFIRMFDSSEYSYVGQVWRALAYDDFDYRCVYVADTDLKKKGYSSRGLSFVFPHEEWGTYNFAARPINIHGEQLNFWARGIKLYSVISCTDCMRLSDIKLFRGSQKLSFLKPAQLLQATWECLGEPYQVYDPERDMWTYVPATLHRGSGLLAHMGNVIFYLSKCLNVIIKDRKEQREFLKALDVSHFVRRLVRQVWGVSKAWN